MEGLELIAFNIISNVGMARSLYIEAIDAAIEGNFEEAENLIKEAEKTYLEGHKSHLELLTKSMNGEKLETTLLLIHAEDQLMSAESFGILAQKFIDLCKKNN